jgi:hypothetical protein
VQWGASVAGAYLHGQLVGFYPCIGYYSSIMVRENKLTCFNSESRRIDEENGRARLSGCSREAQPPERAFVDCLARRAMTVLMLTCTISGASLVFDHRL